MRWLILVALAAALATPSAAAAVRQEPQDMERVQKRLDAAKARWKKLGAKSYTYKVQPHCSLCANPEQATVVVTRGKATITPALQGYEDYKTVPRLFALIQGQIDEAPYRLDVRYGSKTGVPLNFSEDTTQLGVDDSWGFFVRAFRRR